MKRRNFLALGVGAIVARYVKPTEFHNYRMDGALVANKRILFKNTQHSIGYNVTKELIQDDLYGVLRY